MPEDEFVVIYETRDPGRAEIVRLALEAEGVTCRIENELQASLTGVLNARLYVPAADADRARAFVADCERRKEESP